MRARTRWAAAIPRRHTAPCSRTRSSRSTRCSRGFQFAYARLASFRAAWLTRRCALAEGLCEAWLYGSHKVSHGRLRALPRIAVANAARRQRPSFPLLCASAPRGGSMSSNAFGIVNVEEDGDNPPFDGVYEFSQMYTGGTLGKPRPHDPFPLLTVPRSGRCSSRQGRSRCRHQLARRLPACDEELRIRNRLHQRCRIGHPGAPKVRTFGLYLLFVLT